MVSEGGCVGCDGVVNLPGGVVGPICVGTSSVAMLLRVRENSVTKIGSRGKERGKS